MWTSLVFIALIINKRKISPLSAYTYDDHVWKLHLRKYNLNTYTGYIVLAFPEGFPYGQNKPVTLINTVGDLDQCYYWKNIDLLCHMCLIKLPIEAGSCNAGVKTKVFTLRQKKRIS